MNSFASKLGVTLAALALVISPTLALAQTAPLTVAISSHSNNATVTVNQAVSFSATTAGGVSPIDINWTFSEGNQVSGPTVSKTFTTTGSKTVTVRARDKNLSTQTATININVVDATTDTKPEITGIDVINKTQTEATIIWTTNIPATSRVIYDTVSHNDITGASAPNYGYANSTTRDDAKVTSHSVRLTGLTPGTQYYFRVLSSK